MHFTHGPDGATSGNHPSHVAGGGLGTDSGGGNRQQQYHQQQGNYMSSQVIFYI